MKYLYLLILLILFIFLLNINKSQTDKVFSMEKKITLKSSAFNEGGMIPNEYTCQGEDISPELIWNDVPENTISFALFCEDPDAPSGNFVHWVIYNIPPSYNKLNKNLPKQKYLPDGIIQGRNDFGSLGYSGPCPPKLHRYYFKIFALDIMLKPGDGAYKEELVKAIKGHIISEGELMGKFEKI